MFSWYYKHYEDFVWFCRPERGSKSEYRALLAALQINKEQMELCDIINENGSSFYVGYGKNKELKTGIEFGALFNVRKSFKVIHWNKKFIMAFIF